MHISYNDRRTNNTPKLQMLSIHIALQRVTHLHWWTDMHARNALLPHLTLVPVQHPREGFDTCRCGSNSRDPYMVLPALLQEPWDRSGWMGVMTILPLPRPKDGVERLQSNSFSWPKPRGPRANSNDEQPVVFPIGNLRHPRNIAPLPPSTLLPPVMNSIIAGVERIR